MYSKKIKVRITNCDPASWYMGRIGETLEVYEDSEEFGYEDPMYRLCNDSGQKIYTRNCEIVSDKALYPTLIESYNK